MLSRHTVTTPDHPPTCHTPHLTEEPPPQSLPAVLVSVPPDKPPRISTRRQEGTLGACGSGWAQQHSPPSGAHLCQRQDHPPCWWRCPCCRRRGGGRKGGGMLSGYWYLRPASILSSPSFLPSFRGVLPALHPPKDGKGGRRLGLQQRLGLGLPHVWGCQGAASKGVGGTPSPPTDTSMVLPAHDPAVPCVGWSSHVLRPWRFKCPCSCPCHGLRCRTRESVQDCVLYLLREHSQGGRVCGWRPSTCVCVCVFIVLV